MFEDIASLKEQGKLFSEDPYASAAFDFKNRQSVVKALCLILPMTVTLPANIVLPERENTVAAVR